MKDQGIYIGYYKGSFCCKPSWTIDLSGLLCGAAGNYQGALEVITKYGTNLRDTTISNISFKVADDIISDFVLSGGELESIFPLPDSASGIASDLFMEILFDNPTNVPYVMTLIRQ